LQFGFIYIIRGLPASSEEAAGRLLEE
jgi:hypothetical protein